MKGIRRAERDAARSCQRCAQAEGDGLHPFHVDTDELCSGAVLHGCAQAVSKPRAIEQQGEGGEEDDAHGEGEEVDDGEVESRNAHRRIGVPGVQCHVVGGEDERKRSLDHHGDCEEHQDGPGAALLLDATEKSPFDAETEREQRGHSQEQARKGIQVHVHSQRIAEIGAKDDKHALRDVDDIQHAKDHTTVALVWKEREGSTKYSSGN
jgi:hypothetical protein